MLVAEQYFSVYVYGISYLGEEFGYGLGVVMSPRVLGAGDLIFWFHSYDALQEDRASVHVGRGTQNDFNDAKIWLEPSIEVARSGRILRPYELNRALKVITQNHAYLLEAWYEYRGRTD